MEEIGALELLALAPPPSEDWFSLIHTWLGCAETVGAAYQAWEELRSKYADALQNHAQKIEMLKLHGEFVLGAAEQANGEADIKGFEEATKLASLAPSEKGDIERFRQQWEGVVHMWENAQLQMRCFFEKASREIEEEIVRRIDKTLKLVRPKLHLTIHHLGKEHCILQFERMGELDAVLLSRLLSGKIPTHYAFLFDDSVSQLNGMADVVYAEKPFEPSSLASPWPLIHSLMGDKSALSAPWKGQIPLLYEGGVLWMLKQKGIVMEIEQVEVAKGQATELLEVAKAQWMVAHFFRWMREGKMELQLRPNAFIAQ
ncbi:MAG: hypothetical protein FWG75_01015 [Cystobacterineae bacterium]|nr:hypothetical protein [Cystobacterineae bacterium]